MTLTAASTALGLFLLRATILLALALLIDHTLRRRPAVQRHRLWSLTFLAILILPALPSALPRWEIPVPDGWATAAATVEPLRSGTREPVGSGDDAEAMPGADQQLASPAQSQSAAGEGAQARRGLVAPTRHGMPTWTTASHLLSALWLVGTLGAGLCLAHAYMKALALERRARDLVSADWRGTLTQIAALLRLRRPVRLRTEPGVRTPMAGGVLAARILLPEAADRWTAERRRVVLAHELAHHAQHDPLRHLLARTSLALLWFHPVAWLAARQSVLAREQACDEQVLALGTRPSTYARELLELAEQLALPAPIPLVVLPMVQRSLLEKRLMSILGADRLRHGFRGALAGAIVLIVGTFVLAAAAPAQSPPPPPPVAAVQVPEAATPAPGPAPIQAALPTTPVPATALPATAIPESAATPHPAVLPLPQSSATTACAWPENGVSFSGTTSYRGDGRQADRSGWTQRDRVLQTTVDGRRICARTIASDSKDERTWTQIAAAGDPVWLEIQEADGTVSSMEIEDGSIQQWTVGGSSRVIDEAANRWQTATLDVADEIWEISRIRGQASTLRGQISTIRGHRSTLRGRISTLHGQVSTMRGQISTIRGARSSLNGQISSLRGHVSSLRGGISSERGSISSLRATLRGATPEEKSQIDDRIERSEARIRELEQEIEDFDLESKVEAVQRRIVALEAADETAGIQARIDSFDLDSKVEAIERQIEELDVEGKVEAIERQIAELDAEGRVEAAEARLESQLATLDRVIASIR